MLLMNMLMINNIIFVFTQSPLFLSIILLSQSLLISIMLALLTKISWISYSLVMVFMSGVMMVFLYVSSLTSNFISYSFITLKLLVSFIMAILFIMVWLMFFMPSLIMPNITENFLMSKINEIYSEKYYPITLLLMSLLLIALVVVTTNIRGAKSALRTL